MQTVYHIAPTFVNRFTKVLHIALSHLMVALQTALKFYNVARVPLRPNMQFSDFRSKLVDSIEESSAVLRHGCFPCCGDIALEPPAFDDRVTATDDFRHIPVGTVVPATRHLVVAISPLSPKAKFTRLFENPSPKDQNAANTLQKRTAAVQ